MGGEFAVLLDGEQGAVAPDIGTVGAHIKGQIAEDQHPALLCQRSDGLPLAVQVPLDQLHLQQRLAVAVAPALKRSLPMRRQGCGPAPPGALVLIMQNAVAGVVLQPGLCFAPGTEGFLALLALTGPAAQQGCGQRLAALVGQRKIHPVNTLRGGVGAGERSLVLVADEPFRRQIRCIQQPGVQRKTGR